LLLFFLDFRVCHVLFLPFLALCLSLFLFASLYRTL
jgi:hypothetical protein